MIKLKKLVERHWKALALLVFWLAIAALFILGLLPKPAILYGESMQPTIGQIGIGLVNTKTPFEELQEGDIITFYSDLKKQSVYDKNQSIVLTHRVYLVDKESNTITTLGDNNKKQKECEQKTLDKKNGNTIETLKIECQQIYIENVTKNQYIGKVIWWATIIP